MISNARRAEWVHVQLGDLMMEREIIEPASFPGTEFELWSVPAYPTGKPEIVRGSDIGSSKQRVQPGDVLLCKINPRINRVWRVGEKGDFPQIASTEWVVLRSEHVNPAFLVEKLREQSFRNAFCTDLSGIGGSLTRARPLVFRSIPITLPGRDEQKRIAEALNGLHNRIRNTRTGLDSITPLVDQFRCSVLAAAFRGDLTADLRAQNPDVEPASVLLDSIRAERRRVWEDVELQKSGGLSRQNRTKAKYQEPLPIDSTGFDELPAGWCWAAIEEITAPGRPIIYGIIKPGPDHPGGVPYVRVTEMKTGTIDLSVLKRCHPERAAQFTRATLKTGDVLVSKDGTIGKVAIVPPELEGGNITQHVLRVSPAQQIDPRFLALVIEAPAAQRWMTGELKGIGLQGVNVGDFRRMPMPLPPLAEQAEIVTTVSAYRRAIAAVEREVQSAVERLDVLDRSILAKAFRGELVPQDPDDEPASVLLERIRAEREAQGGGRARRGRRKAKA